MLPAAKFRRHVTSNISMARFLTQRGASVPLRRRVVVESGFLVSGTESRALYLVARYGVTVVVLAALVATALVIFRPGDEDSTGVAFADPEAWIEHGLEGELLKVNGSTGEVTTRIEVADPGADLAVAPHGSGAALINRTDGQLTLIEGQRFTTTLQIDLELSSDPEDRALQVHPSSDFERAVIVSDSDQIMVIDPQTSVVESIPISDPLSSVAAEPGGRFVGLIGGPDTLVSIVDQRFNILEELPPAVDEDQERHVVSAGGETFFVDPVRLTTSLVLASGELDTPFCLSGATQGALFGGSGPMEDPLVVSFNVADAMVAVASPSTGCAEIAIDTSPDDQFGDPVVADGFVYLPNYSQSQVHVVDIAEAAEVSVFPFGTNSVPFDLELRGAAVWANQPLGASAAVMVSGEITRVVKIESVVAGSVEFGTTGDDGEGGVSPGENVADEGGLRILGATGEAVLADGGDPDVAPGEGSAEGGLEVDEPFDDAPEAPEVPLGVGVQAAAIALPEPVIETQAEPADVLEPDEEPIVEDTDDLIANFAPSAVTANVNEPIRFTDFSSGDPTSFTWDFGDGTGARDVAVVDKAWEEGGTYLVSLIIANDVGDEASQSVEIVIVPETVEITPTADFGFDRDTVEVGDSVTFTSRSTGSPDSLQWDFGDNSGDLGRVVTHTYDEPGNYTVTLTAASAVGSTTASTVIRVLSDVDPPEAVIGDFDPEIVDGQLVTFTSLSTNDPTSITWDFGDGTSGSGETVRHLWEDPGNYRVRLEVSNSAGSDSAFVDIQVDPSLNPPRARFIQTATEVFVDEVVTFTDLSTNNPTSLEWNFGDDTTRRGDEVNKRWSEPGTYRVTLDAENDAGSDRAQVTITVLAEPVDPPSAAFRLTSGVVSPGEVISFTDQSQDTPTEWEWDFGDGSGSDNQSPTHAFTSPGIYQVSLRVSNAGGSSTASQQVTVLERSVANFEVDVDGRTVTFSDSSTGAEQWEWDFGDGTTSTQRSPQHTYASGGTFDVTLVVRNQVGASQPRTVRVQIIEPPVAVATCAVVGRTVECDASGSQNVSEFLWINDNAVVNTTPNAAQTVFAFTTAARRTITLRVTSPDGQQAETQLAVGRVLAGLAAQITDVIVTQDADLISLEAVFENSPVAWNWELDGADLVQGGNGPTAVFRVPDDGRFTGEVSAENPFGQDVDALRIDVQSFEPVASFTWEVVGPGLVELINTSSAQDDFTVTWRTPDRDEVLTNNRQTRVVQYPLEGGRFTVGITVTDRFGSDEFETEIVVPAAGEPPTASFTWEVVGPGLVQFENTSEFADDFAVTWRTPGSVDIPARNRLGTTVQYPLEGGVFAASLEVRDDFGTDTFETNIIVPGEVIEPDPVPSPVPVPVPVPVPDPDADPDPDVDDVVLPVADFTWSVIEPGVVEAINTSTAADAATFAWQAVGEEEVLVRNANRYVVRFAQGGTFQVRLFLTSPDGNDQLFQNVVVPDF